MLLVAVLALGLLLRTSPTQELAKNATTTRVALVPVAALGADGDSLTVLGEVRNVSQAELRAQASGKVTRVNTRTGSSVAAGTVLAELENAAQRAGVLQAEGAVLAAEAHVSRVKNGARPEDRASASAGATSAEVSFTQARENARAAYSSAFSAAQDAVFAKADTFFSNQYTVRPSFRITSASYDEAEALGHERAELGTLLDAWKDRAVAPLPDDALQAALTEAQATLDRTKRFLDRVAYFVAKQEVTEDRTAAAIAADNAALALARQAIDGARAGVVGAQSGLAAAWNAATTASLNESKIVVGERREDVQAAEAGLLQARGALAAARASLEYTLIRTPIAGTVTSLSIAAGDFLSPQQQVAVVAREGAQEVVAYVSDAVRSRSAVGMHARVAGSFAGVVVSLDPGLDPATKLARMTVSVPQPARLTNGSFVEVALTAATSTRQAAAATSSTAWYLPIEAIKVLPGGLAVLTVSDGVLTAVPIPEGTIIGDRMLVRDTLMPDLKIVADARGKVVGERVEEVENETMDKGQDTGQ